MIFFNKKLENSIGSKDLSVPRIWIWDNVQMRYLSRVDVLVHTPFLDLDSINGKLLPNFLFYR